MIITLTVNPALDQTVWVERLEAGEVNRVHSPQLDPAGKGINVSRMVDRLGWPTIAFGFLAGEIGMIAHRALDDEGVQHHFLHVSGQTRLNLTVVDEATGASTSLYGPGPSVEQEHLDKLRELIYFWLQAGRVLVVAGSLPPGAPENTYATYIRAARAEGVKVILDADDEAFRLGVKAKPDLIKPNVGEAERLLERPLPDLKAAIEGAKELVKKYAEIAVVSMGAQGALLARGNRVWRALPPRVERLSTVGSGDSLVAGLAVALARGDDILEGLRIGTAAGAATAMTPGTALGAVEDVMALAPRVRIEELV